MTAETKEKLDKIDADFVTQTARLDAMEKEAKKVQAAADFPAQRQENLHAHMVTFNQSLQGKNDTKAAGVPAGGFEDVKAYAMYEDMFAHALSHVGMARVEARFGSSSDEFKMAQQIHAAINDSSQPSGGALVPEAFTSQIEHVARLMSPILGKVRTIPTTLNEVERILATTTSVQRSRGAATAEAFRGNAVGGNSDSTPSYYEQKCTVIDAWTRPYVHEDQLEDAVASLQMFLLEAVTMDFVAEEEMQCVAGTASVTNGAIAGNDAWQGIFGGTGILAQTVDGTAANFSDYYTDGNRFRPVVRIKTGVNGSLGNTDATNAKSIYNNFLDLQFAIKRGYRTAGSCYVGSTATLLAARRLKDTEGRPIFDMDRREGNQYRPMVLGREFIEAEHAPDAGGSAAANYTSPLFYGDLYRYYTRVKRLGLRMKMLDHQPPYISYYFRKRDRGMVFDNQAGALLRAVA